ncbi:MAG: hypothetical protein GWO07_09420 [Candidatus Dadabacteria bacterium]|nr:hypothetical protein [Candidatus Dadabacteria bacterium]NIS08966.1 hypothetical protein [Candidatus Dadabacteria bacterium]NIV40781.1 hypothetical protein [Candidatus Dadabacteria bacterium]NIY22273.1 hypothetical protein [Candidatus Dadabacteria bacterium]
MNDSSQIISNDLDSTPGYVYNDRQSIDRIFSSFADYLLSMKEVTSLMIYTSAENINELTLVEYRNVHQDFPRNFSRIERTKFLAKNIIKSNLVMQVKDTEFGAISNKFGINIKKGFIGIPIKDKAESSSVTKRAILLWTSYLSKFGESRFNFILSAASYLSKAMDWNSLLTEDYNEF